MKRSLSIVMSHSASAIWKQFARSVAGCATALRHRKEIRHLAEFDDCMLKDIGLIRSDVESALAEPIHHNPSWVLVRCAERHTRAERLVVPSHRVRPVVPTVTRAEHYA